MRYHKFYLQQFSDGGEAGGEAATTGEATSVEADAAEEAAKHAEEWNNLIKGDYREDYQKAIKEHVDRRFKHQAELEEKIGRSDKLIAFLGQRYETDDPQTILEKIMDDDAIFAEEALERGLTTDQYKQFKKLEFERDQAEEEREEIARQRAAEETMAEWVRQGDYVKGLYPEFDLEAELSNERFSNLLMNNVDMQTAYEVCHKDDIITGAMRTTAQTVAEKITDSIRTKGMRPLENGIASATQPVGVKPDIDKMSIEDMETLYKRAVCGEKITLR